MYTDISYMQFIWLTQSFSLSHFLSNLDSELMDLLSLEGDKKEHMVAFQTEPALLVGTVIHMYYSMSIK